MHPTQDFTPVVIRKPQTHKDLSDSVAVTAARREGKPVDTSIRQTHATAPGVTSTGLCKSAAKLDAETEDFRHDRVPSELKTQIARARTAKKMTQAQLAQSVNEKPQVVQEYENGKAIPTPQVLSKLSRVLGVTLRKK